MKPINGVDPNPGKKPLLGVIGGMGTQATSRFYEKLHSMQTVITEQEYLDVLLYSKPTIPDRTAYILGESPTSPLEPLISVARTLENAGVTCIALPCVTSHYFYEDLLKTVKVPILHIPNETARTILKQGFKKVCLFATDGTIKGKVFHTAFEQNEIDLLLPSSQTQSDLMEIIYSIKKGEVVLPEKLETLIAGALSNGADAVVLGCTEFCVIAKESPGLVNTLEVLAGAAIEKCKE